MILGSDDSSRIQLKTCSVDDTVIHLRTIAPVFCVSNFYCEDFPWAVQ